MALSPYRYGFESVTQTVPTEQQTAVQLEDSAGQVIDPARNETLGTLATEASLTASQPRGIDSWTAGTVPVEQQTPLSVETPTPINVSAATVPVEQQTPVDVDNSATVTDSDSGLGAANAASVTLGSHRKLMDIHVATTGAATLTVEVSPDGGATWLTFHEIAYSEATTEVEQYECAFADVRAHLDANRTGVTISAKGL